MLRRFLMVAVCAVLFSLSSTGEARAEQAFGRVWGGSPSLQDWERFYHYPYVYYPQNYQGSEYNRSRESLYYRYPPEMRVPVYNRKWFNYYPNPRRYHWGHHFVLDVL